MSTAAFELPNGVLLDIHWRNCEDGSEEDEIVFEYFGSVAGLIEVGFPAKTVEKMYSGRGRPEGMKIKHRVDGDGDRIRICQRRKSKVRVKVYKPLEHALRHPHFDEHRALLKRFKRGRVPGWAVPNADPAKERLNQSIRALEGILLRRGRGAA